MRVYNHKLQINWNSFRLNDFWPTYSRWALKFGQNLAKYLVVTTFFQCAWDIDLIFGIWVYNDELQIKFTFRSGPMIFGRVMALRLWNLAKYLVVTTLFHYDLRYLLDFWYEVYNHKLQINFEIRSGWMIFG